MADTVLKDACLILLICVTVVSGELCTYYSSYYSTSILYKYCSTGCCGTYYNQYCCVYTGVGVIVGAAIGSIVFFAVVVTVIAVVCCRIYRGRSGQVSQPTTTTTTVIGMQTGAAGYGPPTYGYDQPGYNQAGYIQPSYNQAGQVGYQNMGLPGQMPTNNVQQRAEQKWDAPPPPYQPNNPM